MLLLYLFMIGLVTSSTADAAAIPNIHTFGLDKDSGGLPVDHVSQNNVDVLLDRNLRQFDGERKTAERDRGQQGLVGIQVRSPTPISTSPGLTTSPATSVSKTPTDVGAKAKLLKLLASLVDWIVPSLMVTFSAATIRHLHNTENDTGLMAGAGAVEGIFALVRADTTTTAPLLIAIFLVYISAHIVYCRIVCHKLAQGEGFVAITVIAATLLLATLVQLPGLVELWTESSGLPSLWTILPLHMVSVYFCSFAVRLGTPFLKTPSRDRVE